MPRAPTSFYRWFFLAHSLRSLERNILGFAGIGPIKAGLIGMGEVGEKTKRERWLDKISMLGRRGR